MFGRKSSSNGAEADSAASTAATEHGKGRPTPKRREAQRGRRRSITAPRDRREAYRASRARQRTERARQMEGLRAGDERNLPARDRGPVRGFARDFVDSRRSVAEFFLPLALVILALTFFGTAQMKLFGGTLWLALLILVMLDTAYLAVRLRVALRRQFPDQSVRGATTYAVMRSMQIRRFRLPPPRLRRGGRARKG